MVSSLNDPDFSNCSGQPANCNDAWALRVVNSQDVLLYGAGFYSFFNNYDGSKFSSSHPPSELQGHKVHTNKPPACSAPGQLDCQISIVSLEGTLSNVNAYAFNTVGATNMLTANGVSLASFSDNVNVFQDTIALFQLASQSGGSTPPTNTNVPTTMSTVTTTAPTSTAGTGGWTFLGCYTDNVSGRALPLGVAVPGGSTAMTVEACTAVCQSQGYVLAGLEYAGECCKYPFIHSISLCSEDSG